MYINDFNLKSNDKNLTEEKQWVRKTINVLLTFSKSFGAGSTIS